MSSKIVLFCFIALIAAFAFMDQVEAQYYGYNYPYTYGSYGYGYPYNYYNTYGYAGAYYGKRAAGFGANAN
uniref:Uncharacterized protein n=1 Tax=Panagrolaimus sp. JU765 TaxID=591449 RepID=A0AC34Q373_9BILA